eukprot:m.36971 g.36971  ORF g.36971 m.36971 type:complete len:569 (-) comp9749_c0_seq1:118-1824(-)
MASAPRRSSRARAPVVHVEEEEDDDLDVAVEEEEEKPKVKRARANAKSGKKSGKAAAAAAGDEEEEEQTDMRTVTVAVTGGAAVDAKFPRASQYHVYSDASGPWDFTGNQTNVANNNNKFYILQLLEKNGGGNYVAWTRWGRVGVDGQNMIISEGDLSSGKSAFEKKFRDKTSNDWSNKATFQHVRGKYDMVKIDYSVDPDPAPAAAAAPAAPRAKVASTLALPVLSLMELLFDVSTLTSTVVEMNYDVKKLPLGKLTPDQLKYGYTALKKIDTLISAGNHGSQLTNAVNDFYTRIPHVFGMSRPPLINTVAAVREKMQLLQALDDIKVAMNIIDADVGDSNPADSHYKSLKCDIKALVPSHPDYGIIQTYLRSSHGPTHNQYTLELLDLFEIDRPAPFDDKIGNRMLLWHGSRLANWAGILGQGLRIAPPEAPSSGYMFGKGIYFADVVSKSANYCFTSRDKNVGLLLLCDVALGTTKDLLDADSELHDPARRVGTHSTRGMGQWAPDPRGTIDMHGTQVPLGRLIDTKVRNPGGYTLNYNEYIVYNPNQVRFRYLLRVKFNYQGRS